MKDYYALDVSEFLNNNIPFYEKVRSEALTAAKSGNVDVVTYIEQRLKEEHDKQISLLNLKDSFEYYVQRHEKNPVIARQVIDEYRKKR